MATIAELFAQAWKHHEAGGYSQAEQLYRQVLQADPSHADAWCFLGAACQSQGKLVDAENGYRQAVRHFPCHPSAQNCLGIILAQRGQFDEAAACFQQLIDCCPKDSDAHNNLGLVRAAQGRFDEAIACYQRALTIRPNFGAARDNINRALARKSAGEKSVPPNGHASGSQKEGEGRAGANKPMPGPPPKLADCGQVDRAEEVKVACRHGIALAGQGRFDEARAIFEKAARLQPDDAHIHNNLGSLLVHQQRYEEAVGEYKLAVRLNPGFCEAHYNLGIALLKLQRREEAKASYQLAVRCNPNHLDAQNNLGNLFKEQGDLSSALECYEQALRSVPGHPGTHLNRALTWLLMGKWKQGWPEYEWRWQTDEFPRHGFRQPRWDGSPLEGRTILLYAEQGLGDTLHFIRYAPLVQQRGGRVIVQCQSALLKVLARAPGIDRLVGRNVPLPPFDLQTPLLSVPGFFHKSPAEVPATVPYLQADPQLVEHWRTCLAAAASQGESAPGQSTADRPKLKIGIAWQGSPTFRDDRRRSIALAHFERLARVPGVQLISLQKGPGSEQIHDLAGRFPVLDLGCNLDESSGAFMDTAAVMKNLDLIISSDTAIPHLAGALAVPVWVALPLTPDWRWQLQRTDSPWYPTMKLFRQQRLGDWDDVFQRIAEELASGAWRVSSGKA